MDLGRNRGDPVLRSFFVRFHQLTQAPWDLLPEKGPRAVSFSRYGYRVNRIPFAAKPLSTVPLFQKRGSCRGPSSRAQIGAFTAH